MSIEMPSSDGQSSGDQSGAEGSLDRRRKKIPFKLHMIKTIDAAVGLGRFHLEIPSNLEISKFKKDGYPSVFFDIKDEDQLKIFTMIKNLSHANIIQVNLIQVQDKGFRVYVEPYLGVLSDLFKKLKFVIHEKTNQVPSVAFQGIVSDVVDGLNYLRQNNKYHGNFGWDTTVYCTDGSNRITKLANFERKKSKTPVQRKVADCHSLGYALAEISERLKEKEDASICCLIDDLVLHLLSITSATMEQVMSDIKNHMFFWDEKRRTTFAAVELPAAWDRESFKESFRNSGSVPSMPWTNEKYDGNLAAMEVYRAENGIAVYKVNEWSDFLRCISGMYTHKKELKVPKFIMSVDNAVQSAHRRLFYHLKIAVDAP